MPRSVASRVLKNIFFSENFPVGNRLDLARQRNRIIDRSERIRKNVEFSFCEQRRNIVGKAGTEKGQLTRVVDFKICGGDIDSREEIHATNLNRISGANCICLTVFLKEGVECCLFFAVFIVKNIDFLYKNSKNALFSIKYLKIYCEKY